MIKKNNQFVISPHAVWEDQMVFWFVFFFPPCVWGLCGTTRAPVDDVSIGTCMMHYHPFTTQLVSDLVKYQDIHFRYNVKSYLDQMC